MSGLTFAYQDVAALKAAQIDELWAVYQRFFHAERAAFDRSVQAAGEVICYRDSQDDSLQGIALVRAYDAEHAGRRFRVIWTGAVALDPKWRGHNAIQASGLQRVARERLKSLTAALYWFFDTFSYKSYLLLPRNFAEYWPRPDRPTAEWEAGALAALCTRQFGELYDARTGLIAPRGRTLREGVAELPSDSDDPHVRYFAKVNPNAARGDCLACLCPLDARNLLHMGAHMARRSVRRLRRMSSS